MKNIYKNNLWDDLIDNKYARSFTTIKNKNISDIREYSSYTAM